MKKFFLGVFLGISLLSAAQPEPTLQEQNLKKQMEKEEKYAQEQRFYQGSEFDLESFKVDENSLKSIPEQPDYNDGFNMDSVYD